MKIFCLMLALAAPAAVAQPADASSAPGDPLRSVECRRALDSLQVQEAAAEAAASAPTSGGDARRPHAPDARLEAARKQAAVACLRSRDDPPPPRQPSVQAPITVLPAPAPRPAPPMPALREPPPAVAKPAERPRFITTCDAIGCWADDGSRLERIGPDLRGPRGLCTVQGTLLTCP